MQTTRASKRASGVECGRGGGLPCFGGVGTCQPTSKRPSTASVASAVVQSFRIGVKRRSECNFSFGRKFFLLTRFQLSGLGRSAAPTPCNAVVRGGKPHAHVGATGEGRHTHPAHTTPTPPSLPLPATVWGPGRPPTATVSGFPAGRMGSL